MTKPNFELLAMGNVELAGKKSAGHKLALDWESIAATEIRTRAKFSRLVAEYLAPEPVVLRNRRLFAERQASDSRDLQLTLGTKVNLAVAASRE